MKLILSLFSFPPSELGDIDYDIQKHNAPGFIGCISGVRYNVYAPLKALFRPNETDPPVTTQGYISESVCGAFPPVLGYVPWEADPWFTGIGEYVCPIMHHFLFITTQVFVFIHIFGYFSFRVFLYPRWPWTVLVNRYDFKRFSLYCPAEQWSICTNIN